MKNISQNSEPATLRKLNDDDITKHLSRLAGIARDEGHQMVRRTIEEWVSGKNRFDRPGEILLGVFVGHNLTAIGGLNIDPYINEPRTGRLRHIFVDPAWRRRGIASQLISRLISSAPVHFDRIRISTDNPVADRLYLRLGFSHLDTEYKATHVMNFRQEHE